MNGKSEDGNLALVRSMKCVPPLNEVEEATKCVRLHLGDCELCGEGA